MVRCDAPAKINWFLYVIRKREDGYHEILSPMQRISLYDSLVFRAAEKTDVLGTPQIPNNIVLKTIKLVSEYKGVHKEVAVELKKEIPVAAGLGGGSSDAASTLETLNAFWGLGLSQEELVSLGAKIGSDVPFFIGGCFSMVRGRGEILDPRMITQSYDLLLVNPGIGISSRWAYENNGKFIPDLDGKAVAHFVELLNKRDFSGMERYMFNSLEEPVFKKYTVIREIKDELKRRGASVALMSGSGSTVFGVFESREQALVAQPHFREFWTRVVKTLL